MKRITIQSLQETLPSLPSQTAFNSANAWKREGDCYRLTLNGDSLFVDRESGFLIPETFTITGLHGSPDVIYNLYISEGSKGQIKWTYITPESSKT